MVGMVLGWLGMSIRLAEWGMHGSSHETLSSVATVFRNSHNWSFVDLPSHSSSFGGSRIHLTSSGCWEMGWGWRSSVGF
jgi:hypothetical protein